MKFVSKPALALALVVWAMHPAAAQAQDDGRLSLSITPALATISGDSEFALAGTVDYRFARHLSFEGDITWIDAAAGGFRNRVLDFGDGRVTASTTINSLVQRTTAVFGGGRNPLPNFNFNTPIGTIMGGLPNGGLTNVGNFSVSTGGSTWIGTMGLRYEPATQTARFQPYVSGGFGVNYTSQDFNLDTRSAANVIDQAVTNSGIAFSAGGGANIKLGGPLWATADAKYFHLSNDRDVIRFGAGMTVKF
jgi:hypothetical protein